MSKYTPFQLSEAQRFREKTNENGKRMSWKKVGKLVGANGFSLRVALDPVCLEQRREEKLTLAAMKSLDLHASPKLVIPHDVLFDRERRLGLWPRSIVAATQGDPLPGMSALDKRGA